MLGKTRADQQAALYARVPDLAVWRGQQPLAEARDLGDLIPQGTLVIELPNHHFSSAPPAEALRAAIASARATNGDAPSACAGLRLIGAFR